MEAREISLFRNGNNQAARIPREFEFEGSRALIYRDGRRLVLEPAPVTGLVERLAQLAPLDEALPDIDNDLGELDDIDLQA